MPSKVRWPAGGFSLAESLLALGLCVIIILVVMELSLTAMRGSEKGGQLVAADGLAQDELEKFIYGLPPVATATFWTTTSFAIPYQTDIINLGSDTYTRLVDVVDLGTVSPGLRQVVVNVSWWNGQPGRPGYGQQFREVSRLVSAP